jgi:predicted Zn-dependent peptidase
VRERRGLAYYIYGHNMGYTDTGTLFAQGGVDIKRIDDAVATVVAEFSRIAAEPLDPDELEKARNFAKGRLVLSLEDSKGMILFGLRDEVLEGRLREPDEVLAGLDAVTLEDVQRVAQDVIRDERLNLALIGPFDDPERFEKLLSLSA